jgi:hypothetical protein
MAYAFAIVTNKMASSSARKPGLALSVAVPKSI